MLLWGIFIVGFYLIVGVLLFVATKNAPLVDDDGNIVDEDEEKL